MALPETNRAVVSRLGSAAAGALLAVGYLLISGLIGFLLLRTHDQPALESSLPGQTPPIIAPVPNTGNDRNPPPVTAPPDFQPTIVNNLSSAPDTPTGPPDGDTPVSGPDGLTTDIPVDWQPMLNNSYYQANDPNDSGRFVRYGATPAPQGALLDSLRNAERTNPNIQSGYQRIQLVQVAYHGSDPAVDWEFLFVRAGVTRHVESRYWETGGIEYFVYVSATTDTWPQTQPIFTTMANTAAP